MNALKTDTPLVQHVTATTAEMETQAGSALLEADLPAIAGGEPAKTVPYGKEARYGQEELRELEEALAQGTLFYSQGKKTYQLEAEFASRYGVPFGVTCNSGTTAVHAALIAAGISPGDEVIVTPITDMGSIVPIMYQGAIPIFADLDPHTYTLDPESVKANITPRTRAIIAVHLWGNSCDLDALLELCEQHDLILIEDCAQAFGCLYKGQPIGTIGHMGCFSFNEFKHIACGDGGIVLTKDADYAEKLRLATDKGYNRRPDALVRQPAFLANNYRMTELQSAVALAQLKKLDSIVSRRRAWCGELSRQLEGIPGLHLPQMTEGAEASWWFYMMRVDAEALGTDVDSFTAALRAEGLPVSAHYIGQPIYKYPVFVQHSAFERASHPFEAIDYSKTHCSTAEDILATSVTLAVNQAYTETDLNETVRAIRRVAAWFARDNA